MTTESLAEDWFCRAFVEAFFPMLLRKASTAERLAFSSRKSHLR
jgi:hypothetical protein